MRKFILLTLMCALTATSGAQTYLSLDSCKAMALRNNKQLNISRLSKEVAKNVRKAARTNLDDDEASPGKPIPPSPCEFGASCNPFAIVFSG